MSQEYSRINFIYTLVVVLGWQMNLLAETAVQKVACVGDSITFGATLKNRQAECYPQLLGQLLGDGFSVRNMGVGGATALKTGKLSYWDSTAFREMAAYAPDIIVVLLGTNDANQHNGNWTGRERFAVDYSELLTVFSKLKSKPQIYLCYPPPSFPGDIGKRYTVLESEVLPAIDQMAKSLGFPVIDLFHPFVERGGLFPDKLHPNKAGAELMATLVQQALEKPAVVIKDGIIHFFADEPVSAVIVRDQIDGKKLWASGLRREGKTRQIRITSYVGGRSSRTSVKFRYPFGDASATWNMDVTRLGDLMTVMIPWNGSLIGDRMDVNEGADAAENARIKLAVADSRLPVLYSSGDSISMGYWPYLEGELHSLLNVYYQREVVKDIPALKPKLRNNGHAHLAQAFLLGAYNADPHFKPDYLLVNFGLHMINTHRNKLPDYEAWVEKFVALAKARDTQLIWVTTTPYEQSFRPSQNLTIIKFNGIAETVAEKHGVPVVDLHACVLELVQKLGAKKVFTDGVHFTEDTKKKQAAYMAERIRKIVGAQSEADK